jgi:Predicted membrane protein
MAFFTDAEVTLGSKLLEIIYMLTGFVTIYTGIKNLRDPENPSRIGTAVFWTILGVIISFGRWIPATVVGLLIIIMCIPAVLKKVKMGNVQKMTVEETKANFEKIGMKVFIPAFVIGAGALVFAVFTDLGALVGVGFGVLTSAILLMVLLPSNKPAVIINDAERMISTVGPLSMLSMLLACLGSVFTAAGVGETIAKLVSGVIPKGNITVGIIIYALGMMLFTIIMGNAFAAITVMTVGIGAPFVLSYGADPVLIGMLALTCGYCGTLLTPMAANFNMVPVALLDMKRRFTVIRNQFVIALIMITFQIIYMIIFH